MNPSPRDVTTEKPLPSNVEAERLILGVILLDNTAIEQAEERLIPGDFFLAAHRTTYDKMRALHSRGQMIDPLTLQDELRRGGELDRVGGPAYIAHLFDGVPRFSDIGNYVGLVKSAAKERRLILLGNAMMSRAFDGEMTVDEQLRLAEHDLLAINDEQTEGHWRDISGVAFDVLSDAEARAQSGRKVLDFSTGFCDLDYITDGFERQTMVAVIAAPKMGKTGFALSLTRKISEAEENRDANDRPPVIGWFSMEMSRKQQARRLLSNISGIDLRSLRAGDLTKDEWRSAALAAQRMAGWRVHFDDRAALTPRAMRAAVRRLVREEGKLDVLIVDYLQLSDGEKQKGETRENEVARISRSLLQIAKDYNCCVIVLSQLNRELFKRADKRPGIGDIRDSGQIGQDAHIVIGLHREEVYNPNTDKQNVAELILLAQREGPLGTIEVHCNPRVMRFEDLWRSGEAEQ